MLQIEKTPPMVQIAARIPLEIRQKVRNLAQELSTETIKVTEGEVIRQIIVDFFSPDSTRKVNGNTDQTGAG